jgi:peptidyl-prolyl cis-trans isomerase B (cyclophilin B)
MKSITYALSTLFLFTGLIACNSGKKVEKMAKQNASIDSTKVNARIKTVHGDIVFKFYPSVAPNTVKRIQELIGKGFYDGLVFHRVVPGFVVQGGDPTGTGTSGSGKKLKAEFNSKKHIPGAVAMARSSDPNSADSQFYICMGTFAHLDNKYTIFGMVEKGMDVVKKISPNDKMISVSLE